MPPRFTLLTRIHRTQLPAFPPAAHGHIGQHKATPLRPNTPPIGLHTGSRDSGDTLSLSLAATSEQKGRESSLAGCRTARGCCPMLHYIKIKI